MSLLGVNSSSLPTEPTPDQIKAIADTFTDPVQFSRAHLNHKPWAKQQEIMQSVVDNDWTSVKACHASGKTFTAADLALWWVSAHKDGIVITTAPTWMQVEQILWGAIRANIEQANIAYPTPSKTELRLGANRYAIGLSTNEGVRFQGFHGTILIIIDEAPGVLPEIYEAIEGIRAGGNVRILELGNPIISSGNFYESFLSKGHTRNLITISAFDTPNFQGVTLESLLKMSKAELRNNIQPNLTTKNWVFEKYHEWGLAHPLWKSKVDGRFPEHSENALISLTWLELSKLRKPIESSDKWFAGLDVAGPGDAETVLYVRKGPDIVSMNVWTNDDPRGEVIAELNKIKQHNPTIGVDVVGIGHYMSKHIKSEGFKVVPFGAGESPTKKAKPGEVGFVNKKAQAYWSVRDTLKLGECSGLVDEKTIAQLASIQYKTTAKGLIEIESKDDMRKRGVQSPDRAEAYMICEFVEEIKSTGNVQVMY